MLIKKVKELTEKIEKCVNSETALRLPGNVYYLEDNEILCCPREFGESRFPYDSNGYTMWVHSTGHIHVKDGLFNVFKPLYDNCEPSVEFFVGMENPDRTYFPVSLTGAAKQLFEPLSVKRYLVYSLSAAYFLAVTEAAIFAVRADMSEDRELRFSFVCINKSHVPLNICFTSYFSALLKHGEYDSMWTTNSRRFVRRGDGCFIMERGKGEEYHALGIKRKISGVKINETESTNSLSAFCGSERRSISGAECLKNGKFSHGAGTHFGIAAEIIKLEVDGDGRIDYVLPVCNTPEEKNKAFLKEIDIDVIDCEIEEKEANEKKRLGNLDICFTNSDEGFVNHEIFNRFIKSVQKQNDICAMGRYYVADLLGTRDVFQQLEQALIWDPGQAREKMLRALGYILSDGRPPRQFEASDKLKLSPVMDLRPFIDQGNWIISCVYSYLSWTGDYAFLDEVCGYYDIDEDENVMLSKEQTSVLEHLIRITDYLIKNIDEDTNCLKILFGDWNDALDGLGLTKEPGKKFGNGVSVMASLHLYKNLYEMYKILMIKGEKNKAEVYLAERERLKNGIMDNSVDTNEFGDKRIIHGWGNKLSYKVGSFSDSDGKSRISFAPNAFWVISGLISETPELRAVVLNALHSLDSRFGLRTLTPAFTPDSPGVGRIANAAPGTAENDCVYIHAAMFSVSALFLLGDCEYAWSMLGRLISPSQINMSKSPFVMTNSYMDNPGLGYNGQSQNDWYTGSGTVFLKNIIRYCIGVDADMDGIIVRTPAYIPFESFKTEITVRGIRITVRYERKGNGVRKIRINGEYTDTRYDSIMATETAYIEYSQLKSNTEILITD